jgi:hypothetical protein
VAALLVFRVLMVSVPDRPKSPAAAVEAVTVTSPIFRAV